MHACTRRDAPRPAAHDGSFASQPGEAALLEARVVLVGELGSPLRNAACARLPRLAPRRDRRAGLAVVREHVVGDEEGLVGRQAEDLLDRADLVVAERVAVRVRGVGVLRRRPADVAAQHDEARAVGPPAIALAQAGLERVEVVGDLTELDDVPAVASKRLRDVVGVRELGRAVDRDVVVVVDVDEATEPEVAGERRGLVAHALLEAAVAGDREHVVVGDLGAEARAQVRLGERDADAVGDALTERTGRDLDAGGVAVLGVARRARAPLAELLEVVELEPEPGEVEHRVEEHRRVPGREHEAVAVGPVRRGRVVAHDPREEHVGERRERHRACPGGPSSPSAPRPSRARGSR